MTTQFITKVTVLGDGKVGIANPVLCKVFTNNWIGLGHTAPPVVVHVIAPEHTKPGWAGSVTTALLADAPPAKLATVMV